MKTGYFRSGEKKWQKRGGPDLAFFRGKVWSVGVGEVVVDVRKRAPDLEGNCATAGEQLRRGKS